MVLINGNINCGVYVVCSIGPSPWITDDFKKNQLLQFTLLITMAVYRLRGANFMQGYLKGLKQSFPRVAFLYALVAYSAIAVMQVMAKVLLDVFTPFNLLLFRSSTLMFINFWVIRSQGSQFDIPNTKLFLSIVKRLIFSVGGILPLLYCVQYIPVSTNVTLQNTGPIFAFFVEAVFFGKSFDRNKLFLTFLCFFGVILILQPAFLFGAQTEPSEYSSWFIVFVCLFSMSAALSMAISFVFIHQQSGRIPSMINLHYSYTGRIIFAATACTVTDSHIPFEKVTSTHLLVFVLFIVLSFFGQNLLFIANAMQKPSNTMPFGYISVILGFVIDILYFQQQFNWLSIVGMILTSSGLLSKWVTHDQKSEQQQTQKVKQNAEEKKEEYK